MNWKIITPVLILAALLAGCEAQEPIRYESTAGMALDIVTGTDQGPWPDEFGAHLTLTAESQGENPVTFDPLEQDVTFRYQASDSTWRTAEAVEVPLGIFLLIEIQATIEGETWTGQGGVMLHEGAIQPVTIQLFPPLGQVVTFADSSLEAAVRAHIGKLTGELYVSDVDTITFFEAYVFYIASLSGMEHMSALTQLYLTGNQISDLTPLANLTNLNLLDLSGNQISDIAPLVSNSGLGSGDELWLLNNPLSPAAFNESIPQLTARGVIVHY
jgi:hypothetical protein